MRRHAAHIQARRQDGGAGRALQHLGDHVGKFFPLKILAGISYFPVPGVEKKKKLPVPRVTEISTVHLFISNLTRAVWGLTLSFARGRWRGRKALLRCHDGGAGDRGDGAGLRIDPCEVELRGG
jgi:hypothetical protein